MRYRTQKQAGDTLVEVLLATVVLSIVLSSAYTLSNRATRINQQAFERTQISNLLQQQAEIVRAARDNYLPSNPGAPQSQNWAAIEALAQPTVDDNIVDECSDLSTLGSQARISNAFYGTVSGSTVNIASGGVGVSGIYRIWSEIENGGFGEYWDVHVFGCWEGLGTTTNNISSIVLRLEDPR
jgi:Tfp pilus assembly protein PilV